MLEKEKNMDPPRVLLMLSGGRDSFLSACRLIGEGYQVITITFDNGCMSQSENINELVRRMIKRFGSERVKPAGIHLIAQNIRPLLRRALYDENVKLCAEYPHLLLSQLNCLACHTTMYLHSIAYCKAHGIKAISEGARKQQKFFVELSEMKERYEKLCREYDIELLLPVYDLGSDDDRKRELAEWRFSPKSYEPQCWIGCPMLDELSQEQRADLARYYDQEIEPLAKGIIDNLVIKKKTEQTDNLNLDYEGSYV